MTTNKIVDSLAKVQDLSDEVMQPIEDEACEHEFKKMHGGDYECEICGKVIGPDGDGDND